MLAEIFSAYDLIIVLVVLLLVFGGSKLPQLARSLGSASHEFKKGVEEGQKEDAKAEAEADAKAKAEGDARAKADQVQSDGATADRDGTANSKG